MNASAALVFILSVFLSYQFLKLPQIFENSESKSNHDITISYDRLISGTTSGNLNQHRSDKIGSLNYGIGCVKDNYFYNYKKNNGKSYLIKASLTDVSNGYPILEGYEASYINIVDSLVFFIGRPAGSAEKLSIYSIGTEGGNLHKLPINTGETITSLITNSNYLYFTVEYDSHIYSSTLDGSNVEHLLSFPSDCSGITLFGVNKAELYYVSDEGMGKIDVKTAQNAKITETCTSVLQEPILTNFGVFYFDSLSKEKYIHIPNGNTSPTIVFNSNDISSTPIDNINYSSDYIFILLDNGIYYSKVGDTSFEKLKGVDADVNSPFYLSNEYCVYEQDSEWRSININWLLAL